MSNSTKLWNLDKWKAKRLSMLNSEDSAFIWMKGWVGMNRVSLEVTAKMRKTWIQLYKCALLWNQSQNLESTTAPLQYSERRETLNFTQTLIKSVCKKKGFAIKSKPTMTITFLHLSRILSLTLTYMKSTKLRSIGKNLLGCQLPQRLSHLIFKQMKEYCGKKRKRKASLINYKKLWWKHNIAKLAPTSNSFPSS